MLEVIDNFIYSREVLGFKDSKGMRKNLKKLMSYLEEMSYLFSEIGYTEAQEYQGFLQEEGQYTAGTISNFIKGASAFFDYLKQNGKVLANPFREIKRVPIPRSLPKSLIKEKEMTLLLKSLEDFDQGSTTRNKRLLYRLHVICELLYSTGMRIGEAARLKPGDIDYSRGIVTFLDVKNGHRKIAFLNEHALEVLRIYEKEMRDLVLDEKNNPELLFGAKASRLVVLINALLAKRCEALDFPKLTSHSFRHAFGYHFLRRGCDIRSLQELLGHKNIKNTEIYTRVDKEDLKEVFHSHHLRNSKEA